LQSHLHLTRLIQTAMLQGLLRVHTPDGAASRRSFYP
jgi:hypothetical protein